MHKGILIAAVAGLSLPLLLAAQSSNVTLPQDKGPSKIDVSSYPAEQQKVTRCLRTNVRNAYDRAAHQHDHDSARVGALCEAHDAQAELGISDSQGRRSSSS